MGIAPMGTVFALMVSVFVGVAWGGSYSKSLFPDAGYVINLNNATFRSVVLDQKQAYLVLFYSSWCGGCQRFSPECCKVWRNSDDDLRSPTFVGAVNCALSDNFGLSIDNGIEYYPSVKYFPYKCRKLSDAVTLNISDLYPNIIDNLAKDWRRYHPVGWPDLFFVGEYVTALIRFVKFCAIVEVVELHQDSWTRSSRSNIRRLGMGQQRLLPRLLASSQSNIKQLNYSKSNVAHRSVDPSKLYVNFLFLLYQVCRRVFARSLNSISSQEWMYEVNKLQRAFDQPLPAKQEWRACSGSEPKYRGYPCSLWLLFHTITVRAYQHMKTDADVHPYDVLQAIYGYVKYFFGCRECANNFARGAKKMAHDLALNNKSEEVVLWLWRSHNRANYHLKGQPTEDPNFPKLQFPSANVCPLCVKPDGSFNETEVLRFLVNFYSDIRDDSSSTLRRRNMFFGSQCMFGCSVSQPLFYSFSVVLRVTKRLMVDCLPLDSGGDVDQFAKLGLNSVDCVLILFLGVLANNSLHLFCIYLAHYRLKRYYLISAPWSHKLAMPIFLRSSPVRKFVSDFCCIWFFGIP
ncbi:unnamed protein product [Soboliphyme baturini]|uniref:Sulfhydryl oxidase n=1 Tax=Soboliphyme baturini TaxID=241478 RepID=A0A183INQ0_9BILA|nr:unnamed protein product [Soboliphyme baturini]